MAGLWRRRLDQFNGFPIQSPPGLQDALIQMLAEHEEGRGPVLDLGSGSGAIASRLTDIGFTDVRTVARDPVLCGDLGGPEHRAPEDSGTVKLDLSDGFASHFDRRFAVVTSSELIEHLPSPRAFLEDVARLLEPGGTLAITTPNVSNWIGRVRFLLFGELRWFDDYWGRELNHVSPITDAQMRLMLDECGFDFVASRAAGSFLGPVAAAVAAPVMLPFLALSGRHAWGDCSIYIARRRSSNAH